MKTKGAAYRRLKPNREENLRKYAGSACAYAGSACAYAGSACAYAGSACAYAGSACAYVKKLSQKLGRAMMRKVSTSRKSKTNKSTMNNNIYCNL